MTTQLQVSGHTTRRIEPTVALAPFIKWPGGKSDELPMIAAAAPPIGGRLIDPFVGGGSLLLATPTTVPAWANDACADLVRLYEMAARSDARGREALDALSGTWDAFSEMAELYIELADLFRAAHDSPAVPLAIASRAATLRRSAAAAGPRLADTFLARLEQDLPIKFRRMGRIQAEIGRLSTGDLLANVQGAIRSAFYMAVRQRYNVARRSGAWDAWRSADFLFLRELAYAAMFRFNARGEFNVPYGGMTYNRKSLAPKVARMFSAPMRARLAATEWRCTDFEPFIAEAAPCADDFVFVDPPYDSEFSAYDELAFGWPDQHRLRDVLEALPSRVMVVIKDTPMIRSLYASERWRIDEAEKRYAWTIKSRNDPSATHLTITNY